MGTKKYLASSVADIILRSRPGPMLDVFAGMCSVGEAVGGSRIVWNNDVQVFASNVAAAFFTSKSLPPTPSFVAKHFLHGFSCNQSALHQRFARKLTAEKKALLSNDVDVISAYQSKALHVGNCEKLNQERELLSKNVQSFPYRLCAITFSDGYFGLAQSIDIDSIRYSIDLNHREGVIDDDEHRWMLIGLCQTAMKLSASTGHFAQHLKPNANNLAFFLKQRTKLVWNVWLDCLVELNPIGSSIWRRKNKAFNEDCLSLLERAHGFKQKPSVIYADPPYTDDQYSRYYHIWETITLYDYPTSSGAGRYRPDRFVTPFSQKTKVVAAMRKLIESSRTLDADLVLSYPGNGLLMEVGFDPVQILSESYKTVSVVHCIDYEHSTMGGSKGVAKQSVKENIYWATKK
jgi:adenine-specific DNA-methyltransferase